MIDKNKALESLLRIQENFQELLEETRDILVKFPSVLDRASSYWLGQMEDFVYGDSPGYGMNETIEEVDKYERK